MDRYKTTTLIGTAIAEVQFIAKNNEGRIVHQSNKIACVNVECEAIKHELYEKEEIYTIDNSYFDYNESDIHIIEGSEFVLYSTSDIASLDELATKKDVEKYVKNKTGLKDCYPLEASKIVKLIQVNMNEICE